MTMFYRLKLGDPSPLGKDKESTVVGFKIEDGRLWVQTSDSEGRKQWLSAGREFQIREVQIGRTN
jgi:hypothetical protein